MSSRRPLRYKEVINPERILANLLRDYVDGNLDDYTFLYRASVVAIDQVGGAFETTPPNPKNSIRARVITNARDGNLADDNLPVFYPLFPHDTLPVKEGEHIYVIFEDANEKTHGIWLCRITDPNTTENANLVPGVQKYQNDPANDFSQIGAEQAVQDTDSPPTVVQVSPEFTVENVPKFVARKGDRVIEGSNNTVIVLGRDRPTNPSSGQAQGAGTIDLVAGRANPNDMDMAADKSRIYITMNSDVDGNLGINVGQSAGPTAAIAIKSDQIRIVARNGMKIVVEGGDVQIDAQSILMGTNPQDPAMLGQKFKDAIQPLLQALSGPAIGALGQVPVPPNPAVAQAATQLLSALVAGNILSNKIKVE